MATALHNITTTKQFESGSKLPFHCQMNKEISQFMFKEKFSTFYSTMVKEWKFNIKLMQLQRHLYVCGCIHIHNLLQVYFQSSHLQPPLCFIMLRIYLILDRDLIFSMSHHASVWSLKLTINLSVVFGGQYGVLHDQHGDPGAPQYRPAWCEVLSHHHYMSSVKKLPIYLLRNKESAIRCL